MELEDVTNGEILGTILDANLRTLSFQQPTASFQFHPFRSAGTEAHKLSAAAARICLASRYSFPDQQARSDVQQLVKSCLEYDYSAGILLSQQETQTRRREAPLQRTPTFFNSVVRTELEYSEKQCTTDISSVADKSFQLLLKTTAPLQTQGGRVGKQEHSPKALRLVHDTRTYTVTQGQLTQTHMSRHTQLHSCLAYQHTRHSRIPLRAQQVFTPHEAATASHQVSPKQGLKKAPPALLFASAILNLEYVLLSKCAY